MQSHTMDNIETVRVISMKDVRSHEREDGHNVMKNRVGGEPGQTGHQE